MSAFINEILKNSDAPTAKKIIVDVNKGNEHAPVVREKLVLPEVPDSNEGEVDKNSLAVDDQDDIARDVNTAPQGKNIDNILLGDARDNAFNGNTSDDALTSVTSSDKKDSP